MTAVSTVSPNIQNICPDISFYYESILGKISQCSSLELFDTIINVLFRVSSKEIELYLNYKEIQIRYKIHIIYRNLIVSIIQEIIIEIIMK